jgi:hypothetical protein
MHRTCREKLFESSPTSPSRTFERGRRRQRSVWGQVLSQIKITLCNRRRGGPCGGAEGDGSEDLHTEYGVKSLSKPRRGGGSGHYLNVRVILIADNGYSNQERNESTRVRARFVLFITHEYATCAVPARITISAYAPLNF